MVDDLSLKTRSVEEEKIERVIKTLKEALTNANCEPSSVITVHILSLSLYYRSKMFYMKYFFYFILLHLIVATPQINLYYTDLVSESDNALQHDCLHIRNDFEYHPIKQEIVSYCMSEFPSKFNVEKDNFFPKFTFDELSKQSITSEQLYLWSAPIDIIENYQFYLLQLSTSNDLSLAKEVFYNCTLPRFGPMCQYQFDYHYSRHSSLNEIIRDFYRADEYQPTNFTCYTHLLCNRGSFVSCLDWSEICDGKVDCLNDGVDEENCWQLEINECKDNEYRCKNGQCIPQLFYRDNDEIPDCLDGSDQIISDIAIQNRCSRTEPSFQCEDITCKGTSLTISCVIARSNLLLETMYAGKDSSTSQNCWSAFKCLLKLVDLEYSSCSELCENNACITIVQDTCPDMLYFPSVPVLFGNIYFAYRKPDLQYWSNFSTSSFYICYDTSQYDDFFINMSKIFFNNMTCVHSERFLPQPFISYHPVVAVHSKVINELHRLLKTYHLTFNYTSAICNRSNMYQCARSSKCISIYRLMDTIYDCPHMDDENITAIDNIDRLEHFKKTHFKCEASDKYIHQSFVSNHLCDCGYTEDMWCEDEDLDAAYLKRNILFQHICDGFIDLSPVMIAGRNETDETDCEQWHCNNIYTRCNNVWNCPNGADEIGCVSHSTLNCSSNNHLCVSPDTNQLICLPIEKANDGNVDCLGATDEPTLCGHKFQSRLDVSINRGDFYCMNQSSQSCIYNLYLCNGYNDCKHGDDEQFCTTNRTTSNDHGICSFENYRKSSVVEKFLCDYRVPFRQWKIIHFQLDKMIKSAENRVKNIDNPIYSSSSIIQMSDQYQSRCHRGLDLRVWLNNKNELTTNTCLCPPSFYGDQCQYQNQRISLTIQFRALSDSLRIPFAIVISLIDDSDKRIIHSYEQITYLALKNCKTKFNIYLLYSTRPKDSTKRYSIQIDFYEKVSLTYRGSVLLPVNFSFLPVHRLAFIVDIPRIDYRTQSCSNDRCVHGTCIKYSNNPESDVAFCQCNPGWSGRYCTIPHSCQCSYDSLCLGVSANNRSICVCPLNKFGPRCLLTHTICSYSTCQNGGQCIPDDSHIIPNQKFICVCPEGFSGNRCEIIGNKLILSFDKDIVLSQSMFIHFIDLTVPDNLVRATTFQMIPDKQDSVIIYWVQPFHLVFTELYNKNYYLTVVQKTYNPSSTISKLINPLDRCPHINELFNETFVKWHLIRRIKYYHLPCQIHSLNLSCFYDDVHFCLCYNYDQKRLANCFNFDHNMRYDCSGQNFCENGAQCLQDRPDCPTRSMCICPPGFHGTRCQFSISISTNISTSTSTSTNISTSTSTSANISTSTSTSTNTSTSTSGLGLSLGVSYYYYFLLLLLGNWE